MKRWEFDRAVVGSDLPAPARLILLSLAVVADWPSGLVPPQYTPSLTTLANLTGLGRSTVAAHLNPIEKTKERDGWVRRVRPTKDDARAKKERTQYQLSIPASPGAGLDKPRKPPIASPGAGLANRTASPGAGLELVQERDGASPGAGHNQVVSRTSSSSSPTPTPVARIAAALNEEEEEAQRIYDEIANDPRVRAPSKYIDSLIVSGDIVKYRKTQKAAHAPYAGPMCEFQADSIQPDYCRCGLPATNPRHGSRP